MKNLYLVTSTGERHEDHIPEGVYDFDGLKAKFSPMKIRTYTHEGKFINDELFLKEEQLSDGWQELIILDPDYTYEDDEVDRWVTNQMTDKDKDDDGIDNYVISRNIIRIVVNQDMEET